MNFMLSGDDLAEKRCKKSVWQIHCLNILLISIPLVDRYILKFSTVVLYTQRAYNKEIQLAAELKSTERLHETDFGMLILVGF